MSKVDRTKTSMEKRSLCLIVLTLFCLVEEIKAGISCRDETISVVTITCFPGHTKELNITMQKIEDAFPKSRKKEDVKWL